MDLTQQKCVACEGNMAPFVKEEVDVLIKQIPGWEVSSDYKNISRKFIFQNFKEVLEFVNRVGDLAESEGHHPDLHITDYKNLEIVLTTHAIGGLSNNDLIMGAKINEMM